MTTATQQNPRPLVEYDLKPDMLSGILTGQLAGLIMAIAMMAVFPIFLGQAAYFPVQVIGSVAFGDVALPTFHGPSFVTGLIVHQLVALAWSIPFVLMLNKIEHSWLNVLTVGLGVGILSQVVDVGLIVPAVMNALHGHNIWAENVPNVWSWIAHLVFGASFLLFLPIRGGAAAGHPERWATRGQ